MKVIINTGNAIDRNIRYVEEFERELYVKYFPNENEREPFKNIVDRVRHSLSPVTEIRLVIEEGKVVAGCISDYYPGCKSIEPIYLVVLDEYRNKGIAKELINDLYTRDDVTDIYAEVDNPETTGVDNTAIDPNIRVRIYEKLGFSMLNFNYVQPPLGDGKDFERGLKLMYKTKEPPLTNERLKAFLTEFYEGLGYVDSDEFRELIENID